MTSQTGGRPGDTYTFWKFPDRGITGGYLLAAGAGLAAYGAGRFGSFGLADPAWVVLATASAAMSTGIRWLRTPHEAWVGSESSLRSVMAGWMHPFQGMGSPDHPGDDARATPDHSYSAAVTRINELLRKQGKDDSPWGMLLPGELTTDASGNLIGYSIEVEESGYFTKEGNRNKVRALLSQAVPGKWRIRFNPIKDIARAELAKEFPGAVAPPAKNPATTMADVMDRYPDSRWTLGVNALGEPIGPKPIKIPHAMLVAGTGGGKSVWARELIEDKRADGWMVFLGDGKGTDFTALTSQPNIVMVSNEPAQHVVLVRTVRREMDRRFAEADKAKRRGQGSTAFDFPPLLVLLDEFASMRQDVRDLAVKDKDKDKAFADDIGYILRKGREARVHMVISSQELRADSIAGSWQENLKLVISLGRPTEQTFNRGAFPDEYKGEVKLIGDRITAQGRGVYVDVEDGEVVEFQSYYGWSPGTTTLQPGTRNSPPTPQVAEAWEKAAESCKRVQKFHPRIGIMVDDPDWRDGERTLADIASTPTIVLDSRDGPIADRVKYDPWSDEWLGAVPLDGSAKALDFAEHSETVSTVPNSSDDSGEGEPGPRREFTSIQAESLSETEE